MSGRARRAVRALGALGAVAVALAAAPRARAQGANSAAERAQLDRTRAERAQLEAQLRTLQASARDLREERRNFERQADATARLVAGLDRQLLGLDDQVQTASGRLARAEAELARQQGGLRRRLVEIYKRGPLHEAEVLLSAATLGELVARYKYLHEVTVRDRALARRVEELRDSVAAQRTLLVRLQAELARNREEQAAEERRLRELQRGLGSSLAQVEGEARRAGARLAAIARDERRLAGLIAAAETARRRAAERDAAREAARVAAAREAERRAAGARRGRPGAAPDAPAPVAPAAREPVAPAGALLATPGARLDWPVSGALVYRFGRVVNANNTTTRWNGIGIGAPSGAAVRAVAAGTVVVAEPIGTYGLTVIVQHGGDYSVYGSLARADVRRGAAVQRGQALGVVGAADPDLPPHLHFELRPGGRAVDPLDLLRPR